jgi:hypothetical protein
MLLPALAALLHLAELSALFACLRLPILRTISPRLALCTRPQRPRPRCNRPCGRFNLLVNSPSASAHFRLSTHCSRPTLPPLSVKDLALADRLFGCWELLAMSSLDKEFSNFKKPKGRLFYSKSFYAAQVAPSLEGCAPSPLQLARMCLPPSLRPMLSPGDQPEGPVPFRLLWRVARGARSHVPRHPVQLAHGVLRRARDHRQRGGVPHAAWAARLAAVTSHSRSTHTRSAARVVLATVSCLCPAARQSPAGAQARLHLTCSFPSSCIQATDKPPVFFSCSPTGYPPTPCCSFISPHRPPTSPVSRTAECACVMPRFRRTACFDSPSRTGRNATARIAPPGSPLCLTFPPRGGTFRLVPVGICAQGCRMLALCALGRTSRRHHS